MLIDGVKVFQGRIGGEEDLKAIDQQQAAAVAAINGRFQNIPLTIAAGPHKIGVTFLSTWGPTRRRCTTPGLGAITPRDCLSRNQIR